MIIDVDTGKEAIHLAGFGADGKIAFQRLARRCGKVDHSPPLGETVFVAALAAWPVAQPRSAPTNMLPLAPCPTLN